MSEKKYNIGAVSQLTGLSTHAIRAWERRYGVVKPERSKVNNRREYSENDLELLILLSRATSRGFNIGNIAHLEVDELRILLAAGNDKNTDSDHTGDGVYIPEIKDYLQDCLEAIENYDSEKLEILLTRAFMEFGNIKTVEKLIAPLTKSIGESWSKGEIRIVQEHFSTEIIRRSLLKIIAKSHDYQEAPALVVTTPAGQVHDIGALIAGSIASGEGWKVIYLGPNLPSEEIAGAVIKTKVRVVLLSIVYPGDDIRLNEELENLRQFINNDVMILAGGNAARYYSKTLEDIRAEYFDNFYQFKNRLKELRHLTP